MALYPKVRIFGYEMLASPSAELNKTEMPVKITDFKQTDSQYEKDAFTNNGIKYSYKYDCAVTVELTNSGNVADWGYVYEDPYGQTALISLRSFASPYTDTRYSYYRNESSSTVRLYGYVKYMGDDEYYYGEPHDYAVSHQGETSCPDGNHPHLIDLGLPSGTKWSCCNVGAPEPIALGKFFAYGEIEEKDSYTANNYIFNMNTDNFYENFGAGSISGNALYDAARAIMGAPWHMPLGANYTELIENCNIEKKTIRGFKDPILGGKGRMYDVDVLLFTSKKNGNMIILPNQHGIINKSDIPDGITGSFTYLSADGEPWKNEKTGESGFYGPYYTIWYKPDDSGNGTLRVGSSVHSKHSGMNYMLYRGLQIRPVQ